MTATASGLQVPDVPLVAPEATVTAKDADASLTLAEYGTNITNTGASDVIVLTLLAAVLAAGRSLHIQVLAAQEVDLLPASGEKIYLAGSGVADKKLVIAGVIGNYADVYCDGVKYLIQDYSGVVTKEA